MLFHTLADQLALSPLVRTRLGVAELVRRSLREELEQALGGPVLRVGVGERERCPVRRCVSAVPSSGSPREAAIASRRLAAMPCERRF